MKSTIQYNGCLMLVLLSYATFAQNIEELGINKGANVSGSFNANVIGYTVNGIEQRRDPFNWFLNGSLNLTLFGYSAPFSFSYSNVNQSFSQPFNQFSFAPQYKWIKTYVGYNSMTFSSYTLAGHIFLGSGLEITPGKWRVSAMYGRLKKATPFDLSDSLQFTNASYKRMGFGLKVGYENNGDELSTNILLANDDPESIPFVLPESQLTPQKNIAIGFVVRKKFLQKFLLNAEYALSALNLNTLADSNVASDSIAHSPGNNLIKGLLPENPTSRYYDAFNTSLGYQSSWYAIHLKYERIAPEYKTLGAYYFNSDLRNITIIPSAKLLQDKLNVTGNVGVQQNNLDESRSSTTKRLVGSVQLNYTPNEKWNISFDHSNFSSYTNLRPQSDPFFRNQLDTLNFYQVSKTTSANIVRNLGGAQRPQYITLNLTSQKASDKSSYEDSDVQSDFFSINASYSYTMMSSGTTLISAINVYKNSMTEISSTYWGPTFSLVKSILQKTMRASYIICYNQTSSTIKTSPVLNNRFGIQYAPKQTTENSSGQHSLSVGVNILSRLESTEQQSSFTELMGTINYTYAF